MNRINERFVADVVNADGRADRLARYRKIMPWFNAFLYSVAIVAGAVGALLGEGPYLGLIMVAIVTTFSIYLDLYLKLMAVFEASGIDSAKR